MNIGDHVRRIRPATTGSYRDGQPYGPTLVVQNIKIYPGSTPPTEVPVLTLSDGTLEFPWNLWNIDKGCLEVET